MKTLNIAVIGAGVVGGGVIEALLEKTPYWKNFPISIKKIGAKNPRKKRNFKIPRGTKLTSNIDSVLNDSSIDLVVELVNNPKVGAQIITKALQNDKHVVTANKAGVADNLKQIKAILSKKPHLQFGFEAAVAGGIPIIDTLENHIIPDQVSRIAGILNGTSNFIISGMEQNGKSYSEGLNEAQKLGYAEADPRADVLGWDARSKLSLLMQLAFGLNPNKQISTQGINDLSQIDFEYAKELKSTIRSLAVCVKSKKSVSAFVSPCLVPRESYFGSVTGSTNAISIDSKRLGNTFLIGQGAGRYPTAQSVVADIRRVARGAGYLTFGNQLDLSYSQEFSGCFYIRLVIKDQIGIIEKVGKLCRECGISLDQVLQLDVEESSLRPFVVTTDECRSSQIEKLKRKLVKLPFVKETPFVIPIIE